jgi:hypothetical protein
MFMTSNRFSIKIDLMMNLMILKDNIKTTFFFHRGIILFPSASISRMFSFFFLLKISTV